jgi:hypothetical protein
MQEEDDGGIRWAGFAVEDGDAVCLDAVDGCWRPMEDWLGMVSLFR